MYFETKFNSFPNLFPFPYFIVFASDKMNKPVSWKCLTYNNKGNIFFNKDCKLLTKTLTGYIM